MGRMDVAAKWIKEIMVWLVVMGYGLWAIRPVVSKMAVVPDYGTDGILQIWIMKSSSDNFRQLLESGKTIFDGNIFYPYKNVMAYSDLLLPLGILTTTGNLLSNNLATLHGWGIVIGQVTTLTIIYIWWRQMTGSKIGAGLATMTVASAQWRMHYQVHLQMWEMSIWLTGLWLIWQWRKDGKGWKIILGMAVMGLQAYQSLLPLYFGLAVIIVWFTGDRKKFWKNKKTWLIGGILGLVIMLPVMGAYGRVAREFNYGRSIREAANNSVAPNMMWSWFGNLGFLIPLIWALLNINKIKNQEMKWLVAVMVWGVIMAWGPVLKWGTHTVKMGKIFFPLPYTVAYYTIPGFTALRTPSRWIWIAWWAGSGIVAITISNLKFEIFKMRKMVGIVGLTLIIVMGGVKITKVKEMPGEGQMPVTYEELKNRPEKVVAILPMGKEEDEFWRMYWSLYFKKTLINGASGFTPPERLENYTKINQGDWNILKKWGAELVITDKIK